MLVGVLLGVGVLDGVRVFVGVLLGVREGVAVNSAHLASMCEIAWQVEFSTILLALTVPLPIPETW